jgi:hypothetical protein
MTTVVRVKRQFKDVAKTGVFLETEQGESRDRKTERQRRIHL